MIKLDMARCRTKQYFADIEGVMIRSYKVIKLPCCESQKLAVLCA